MAPTYLLRGVERRAEAINASGKSASISMPDFKKINERKKQPRKSRETLRDYFSMPQTQLRGVEEGRALFLSHKPAPFFPYVKRAVVRGGTALQHGTGATTHLTTKRSQISSHLGEFCMSQLGSR